MFKKEYLHQPSEKYPSSHAAGIALCKDGTLIASWFAGTWELQLDVCIMYRRRLPGKTEWEPMQVLHKTPNKSDGNSCYYVHPDGKITVFFNTCFFKGWSFNKIRAKTSNDNGATWSEPRWFRKKVGWLIRSKAITLKNGEALLPAYSEFAGYKSFVCISKDNFMHYKKYGKVGKYTNGILQPSVVQLSNGDLLMYCRTETAHRIAESRSNDNGRHWSPPTLTQFKNPNAGIDLHRVSTGELILVYNDSETARTPLKIAMSEDEGKTWPYEKVLEEIPTGFSYINALGRNYGGEFSYPQVIDDALNGRIHIIYTEHRRQIVHLEMDLDWIRSK